MVQRKLELYLNFLNSSFTYDINPYRSVKMKDIESIAIIIVIIVIVYVIGKMVGWF